jgi:hypothetical protein
MSKALQAAYHWSDATQRYMRCVAEIHCPYGSAHTTPAGMAKAGGAKLSTHGHSQVLDVSSMWEGHYSIGTPSWVQVYDEDGNRAPRAESEKWRARRAKAEEEAKAQATASATSEAEDAPAFVPVSTGIKPFELAESSSDPGVLAMLAGSTDPAVRLVVVRNPATAIDTLEQLALSEDNGWKMYRLAALEELGFRYQDERDTAELEACAQMERDGILPKLVSQAPAAAVVATMPQRVWERKTMKVRRSLIQRAMNQLAKMLGVGVRITGWTKNKMLRKVIGPQGVKLVQLPGRLARELHLRQLTGWMLDFFRSLEGDAKAQARVRRKLARHFGFA